MDQTVPATVDDTTTDAGAVGAGTVETVSLTAIERLADKVSALVDLLDATRRELAEARQENAQLKQDLDNQGATAQHDREELQTLRAERAQLQTRVAAMLDQLEAIEL